jgi:hypothetical protein
MSFQVTQAHACVASVRAKMGLSPGFALGGFKLHP